MLTDDDLTRELGEAFRAATTNLTYTGRTRRPRGISMTATLPAAAVAAALVGAGVGVVTMADDGHRTAAPLDIHVSTPDASPSSASASAAASAASLPRASSAGTSSATVTDTITLAGYTIRVPHPADQPDPVFAEILGGDLPAGFTPLPSNGSGHKAWVGTDPGTGDNALYESPVPGGSNGTFFVVVSATWSRAQLAALYQQGKPTPVPFLSAPAS